MWTKETTSPFSQRTVSAEIRRACLEYGRHIADTLRRKGAVTAYGSSDSDLSDRATAFNQEVQRRTTLGQMRTFSAQPLRRIPLAVTKPVAYWASEGKPIPLARGTFDGVTLAERQLVTALVLNKEILPPVNDPGVEAYLLSLYFNALVNAEDTKALSADAASDASPAGLLHNAPQLGGGSPFDSDISELVAYVSNGDPTRPVFITSTRGAFELQAHGGSLYRHATADGRGNIGGIPLIISKAAAGKLILVDAAEIVQHDGGLEVGRGDEAAVEMVDSGSSQDASSGTGATMVSAFQAGLVVLRMIRYRDWAKLRDDAVGYIDLGIGGSPA